jgi:hypothetical protein
MFSYYITNIQCIWAVRHASVCEAFIDAGAAEFCLSQLQQKRKHNHDIRKREMYAVDSGVQGVDGHISGSALGPDWVNRVDLRGGQSDEVCDTVDCYCSFMMYVYSMYQHNHVMYILYTSVSWDDC